MTLRHGDGSANSSPTEDCVCGWAWRSTPAAGLSTGGLPLCEGQVTLLMFLGGEEGSGGREEGHYPCRCGEGDNGIGWHSEAMGPPHIMVQRGP